MHRPQLVRGRKGNDQLQGGSRADEQTSSSPKPATTHINIYGANDTVCAGTGDDSILAGENSDSPDEIDAGKGTDFVSYNNGGPVHDRPGRTDRLRAEHGRRHVP